MPERRLRVIVVQDLRVVRAVQRVPGGAVLAHADAVAVAGPGQVAEQGTQAEDHRGLKSDARKH